ncbi:hypothetical protein MRX96_034560 [Rhipicephalus microplus]
MFTTSTYRGRTEALRELYQQRNFTPFNWLTADSGVSVDELYQCFLELCQELHRLGHMEDLQQVTTEALVSPLLNREPHMTKELDFLCFQAHYQDPRQEEHTFSMARSLVPKYAAHNRAWNLFGLAVNLSPVMRQNRFCLRQVYKQPHSVPLGLLNGHNALVSGTYKHALGEYVQLLKKVDEEEPLLLLCAGLSLVHISSRRPSSTWAAHCNSSVSPHLALNMYQRALDTPPAVQGMPDVFDLRCEIAFNMSLLYQHSGNTELASSIVAQHCII